MGVGAEFGLTLEFNPDVELAAGVRIMFASAVVEASKNKTNIFLQIWILKIKINISIFSR